VSLEVFGVPQLPLTKVFSLSGFHSMSDQDKFEDQLAIASQ